MNPTDFLETSFKTTLALPDDATEWLLDVWQMIQAFDDVVDGDKPENFTQAIWTSLAGMSLNPFHERHRSLLQPIIIASTLKWMAANHAEGKGLQDERSYMWRAGYYDLVMMATALCHGHNSVLAFKALNLYGETFDEYKKEFGDA